MTKQKSTKRALLLSALALLLCVSMLVGSTFAWFTDSVTSAGNKIVAGTLDVDLYLWNGTQYAEITNESAPIFGAGGLAQNVNGDTLWEPSKTQVAYLMIKNAGNLALKYSVALDVVNVKNDLYKVMKYAITPDAKDGTGVSPWTTGKSVTTGSQVVTTTDGAMLPNSEHYFALSIHMDETAGNEYQAGQVNFDLKVLATQLTAEEDSFNNQYDKDATMPSTGSAKVPAGRQDDIRIPAGNVAVTVPKEADAGYYVVNVSNKAVTTDDEGKSTFSADIDLLKDGTKVERNGSTKYLVEIDIGKNRAIESVWHKDQEIPKKDANPDGYTYDPNTGIISFMTDSFSPFEVIFAWNGAADTSWYNDTDTEFVITTAEKLAGLAEIVNTGNTFAGKTVKLGKNINLYAIDTTPSADGDPLTFRPIGDHNMGGTFEGTFDGQGYTIYNLYQNGWDLGYEWGVYGSYGLFGNLNNATVKNLTLSGGESYIEGGDVSFVAGSATGTCVFENITIEDSIAATYNNGCGGIIGWSGEGNYTFKNITIAEDAVLAGLWGSFDSSIGGIVGQAEPGATYNFDNVDIKCRLDAYNDCTASYDYYNYRMCGMIMGRLEETTTIDGSNYPDTSKYNITCKDVTVTYGDWANYHYCEPTPGLNGGRGMRVESGYSYGGLPADYDHSQCVDNHMNLIPFDQIFGGDQIAVKGLKTYDGVEVIYNNK